jgi:hypothetical protein
MGCCSGQNYNKEGLLYSNWALMPIRNISFQDYVENVKKVPNFSKPNYFTFLFEYNKYVIYGDENCVKGNKNLFEELYSINGPEWVIFSLAFLTKFNADSALNKVKLIELSNHLKLRVVDNGNRKYYMNEAMFRKFYKIYISIISDNGVDPIFNSHFGDDDNVNYYKKELHNLFREEIIDLIISYHIEINDLEHNGKISLDEFLKHLCFLNNDEEIRKLLEDANINRGKYTSKKKLNSRSHRVQSIAFEDEVCDSLDRFAEML